MADDVIDRVVPPLTLAEEELVGEQNKSCRTSYMWKNGLTGAGGGLVAVASGLTIGGAYAAGLDDTTARILFGVSAGTMAALGSGLAAIGSIIQQNFNDRGCTTKMNVK